MARRSDGLRTQRRILSSCVKLFLEHGYHKTTMQQIYDDAHVSASSFQNLFGNKDGVLVELMRYMYENQFDIAGGQLAEDLPPVYLYALETSLQIALADLNESIRECYLEAYTYSVTLDYIQKNTAKKLHQIFGSYQPELTEEDFYALDFGSAGMMRGYMANPSTGEVTLERKLRSFLALTLRGFKVPEDEVQRVIAFILGQDIRAVSMKVMDQLFHQLAMHYDFSLEGLLPEE